MDANRSRSFLARIKHDIPECLPIDVVDRCKEAIIDYLGVTYAGRAFLGEAPYFAIVDELDGRGDGLAIATGRGVPMKDAVFLNGLHSHALDCDDGVNAGIVHLGSPILSLLLPLACREGASGSDLIRSAVSGYEAAWTLAYSIQPTHKLMGFHATGTCGMLGAIVSGACLLGYGGEETFRAFSVGCLSASGFLKAIEDGSGLKPYNVAKASLMALVSLQMARARIAVPDDVMSGGRGFLKMMAGSEEVEIVPPLFEGRYAIMRTYTKPYAACRYCHPAIEAAIRLREESSALPEDVVAIDVLTYGLAVRGHDHIEIEGAPSAKMSIPYGVAVGFSCGKAGLAEYSEAMSKNRQILSLCRKVSVTADDRMTSAFPEKTIASVRLRLKNGSVFETVVDHPLGEPENPLGFERVCKKFREMADYAGKDALWQNRVVSAVENIEEGLPILLNLLKEA